MKLHTKNVRVSGKVQNVMHFQNYPERINFVKDIKTFRQLPIEKHKQNRFAIKNNNMFLEESLSLQRLMIRDTTSATVLSRYPFTINVYLSEIIGCKGRKKQRIENYILENKQKLLVMEKECSIETQPSLSAPKYSTSKLDVLSYQFIKKKFRK